MKSARRQKRLEKAKKFRLFPFFKLVLFAVPFALVFLFLFLSTKYWNGKDKISVVSPRDGGDVEVKVYDPKLNEVTTLVIPGTTEVVVSQNLGTFPIKNVWKLGTDQKLGGVLLSQTVTRNFSFPVFLWKNRRLSDIPVGDRLRLYFFEMGVGSLGKTEINLGKSQYLKAGKLTDGSKGYIITGDISERLTAYFSDNDWGERGIKIYIKDATGTSGISDSFGRVLQVMGGKVVTVDKVDKDISLDCSVSGKDKKVSLKIAELFGCKVGEKISGGSMDLEVNLGGAFAKRF
jgi:hypothetical protein